jgi:hypothetical protein
MFHLWTHLARPNVLNRRLMLAIGLPLLVLGYIAFVLGFGDDLGGAERHFTATAEDRDAGSLDVYATILSLDPVNEAAHLRLYLTGKRAHDRQAGATASKLRVDDGHAVQELVAPDDGQAPPVAIEITMDGSRAAFYPLERYRAQLSLLAQNATGRVPVRLTLWDAVAGWRVRAIEDAAGPGDAGAVRVQLGIRRSAALAFLALAIYGTMILIGAAALTVGGFVFLQIRKLEAPMASFLSGMLFALPAMRYALPGSPPFGVVADQLAFLWAELAAALGLLLWVLSWTSHGPRQ